MDAHALGRHGEAAAAEYYRNNGYDVLDTNWRCPLGEIDLVVTRQGTVVFCEVKTRRGRGFGGPAAAVGHDKQRRVRRLAAAWLASHRAQGARPVRFDVAAVQPVAGEWMIEVIEAAF